jgi:hypothetical protein
MAKRTILTVEVEPELMEHLREKAKKNNATLSRYIRNKLKTSSGYKEKALA